MSNNEGPKPIPASSPTGAQSRMGRPMGMDSASFDTQMEVSQSIARKSQQRVSFKEPLKTGKHAWFDMIE